VGREGEEGEEGEGRPAGVHLGDFRQVLKGNSFQRRPRYSLYDPGQPEPHCDDNESIYYNITTYSNHDDHN